RHLPPAAPPGRGGGHRGRPGHLQEDRRGARREDPRRVGPGAGGDVLLQPAALCRSPGEVMSRPCVLLVDDDAETALVVRLLCRRGGEDLVHAPNVATALCRLAEQRPALVLLDVNLAGRSGLELLSALRGVADRPPVALFCQSGLS